MGQFQFDSTPPVAPPSLVGDLPSVHQKPCAGLLPFALSAPLLPMLHAINLRQKNSSSAPRHRNKYCRDRQTRPSAAINGKRPRQRE